MAAVGAEIAAAARPERETLAARIVRIATRTPLHLVLVAVGLLWLIPTVLAMALVTFLVMHATPGSPLDPVAEGANPLSPEAQKNLAEAYGLDKPLWEQFAIFIGKSLRGDIKKAQLSRRPELGRAETRPRRRVAVQRSRRYPRQFQLLDLVNEKSNVRHKLLWCIIM